MGLRTLLKNVVRMSAKSLADEVRYGYPVSGVYPYINNIGSYSPFDYEGSCISPELALQISTVFTCVLVRAESLSTFPCSVKQSTDEGSRVAYEHPAYNLLHTRPNPFQTAADFWKTVSAQIDLTGNSYGIITYSGRFQPKRIDLVEDPSAVQILKTDSNNPVYEFNGRRYQSWEVLHFKDMSLDGYYGCSKIRKNAATLKYAGKLKTFGANAIGVKPPGYFATEQGYDVVKKNEDNLSKGWNEAISIGKTPLLPYGLKYMNLQILPGDAQYLEAIGATKEDIYGIFRVPPSLAQNYERATWANAEQQDLVFVKYTMLPIITNIEQECNAKLFAEGNLESDNPYYVKFNVNSLLRGDFVSRTTAYRALWERGLITGNMIADLEDWNHFEGGERRFVPMNMIPLDMVDEFVAKLTKPVNTNIEDTGGSSNETDRMLDRILEEMRKSGRLK